MVSEIIIDTHALIWVLSDSPELSTGARDILARDDLAKVLSVASVWEMAIKISIGKLRLPMSLAKSLGLAGEAGLRILPVEVDDALGVEHLPWHHRDPFDRLLASQCLQRRLPLLSRDEVFDQYGVHRVW